MKSSFFSVKKVLIALVYLLFIIFPILFACRVYSSFGIESQDAYDKIKFDYHMEFTKFQYNPPENEQTTEIVSICSKEIALKAGCSLFLSLLWSSYRKIIKMGV